MNAKIVEMKIDIAKENKEIIRRYRHLLKVLRSKLKGDDAKLLRKAFQFTLEAHKDMRRKSGEPYVYHPLEVARIVCEDIGLGPTSVIVALLHDVVEDTEFKLEDIERMFGKKVATMVDGLTKISSKALEGKSIQAENFRKMLLTIAKDTRVVLIKLADRLHNMRTLDSMPRDKRLKIRAETEYIYAPLAHRLGMNTIKSELEDLCLKYANPDIFNEIQGKIERSHTARARFAKSFVKPIEESLKKNDIRHYIKMRTKSVNSIYNKMKKQGVIFEEIYDVFAIRIIIHSPKLNSLIPYEEALKEQREQEKALCWKVYSLVTDHYQANPKRLRDWIGMPRANGYESLHTTVMSRKGQWVEVQIRTTRMDEIAEKGYAAHYKYKGGEHDDLGIERWLNHMRELLEQRDVDSLELLDSVRDNFFDEEVFVFTPQGELKSYPYGATVLDFAFDIHTTLGAHCVAAKVNKKLVPLNYKLQNGDQIEIIKTNKQNVNEGWLEFVVTSKAKAAIKRLIKNEQLKIAQEGKDIIKRKLDQLGIPFNDQSIHQLMTYFDEKNETELFMKVGSGAINHTQIKKFKDEPKQDEAKKRIANNPEETVKTHLPQPLQGNKVQEVIIGGKNNIIHRIASCCSPIPGDDVFGYFTAARGVSIHRINCPNAVEIMARHAEKLVRVSWSQEEKKEYVTTLLINGTDRVGLVSDVTRAISSTKVNIKSIDIKTNHSVFYGRIELAVHDIDEARQLIELLRQIEGVIQINRVEL